METVREKAAVEDGVTVPVECIEMSKRNDSPDLYAHFHNYVEIIYLYDGQLRVWLNGREYILNEGEIVIINSKESHRLESDAPESRYYVIKFNPEILWATKGSVKATRYVLPFLNSSSTQPRVFLKSFVEENGIAELIYDAMDAWKKRPVGYELFLRGDVLKIFGHVVGYLSNLGIEIKYTVGTGTIYGAMDDIVNYINENYLTCDERELAKKYRVSYSYFSRAFKQVMNMTFKEYINYLRINEAQRLLLTTNMSITDISMEMGFSSASHFINVFRRHMGRSPKQYRKNVAKTESEQK